jgi:hypothetical protein
MLAAAKDQRGPLTGWDMYPEQINWLCNDATRRVSPNAIMNVDHLDIYTVSDSTRNMHSAGTGKNRNITRVSEIHTKHCTVDAESGATAHVLIKHIIEAGDLMMKRNNGCAPLAGTMFRVAWNLNEVFENEKLILGDYDDVMRMGLKLLLGGMALGGAAKQCFPRSVFVVGGSSANWETRGEFDWCASCSRLVGINDRRTHCVHW